MDSEPGAGADRRTGYRREDKEPRLWVGVRTSLVARVNHQAMSEVGHRLIFKGQLSILLRLLEFVRNRELSKLSNKDITENPHMLLGTLLNGCSIGLPRIRGASVMRLA